MEFIISKGNEELPKEQGAMENLPRFNMWETRKWPYKQLLKGDIIYWFDKNENKLVWKTEVLDVVREYYSNKNQIEKKYRDAMTDEYFNQRSNEGYLLHYPIKVLQRIDIPRPNQFVFDRLGWESLDSNEKFSRWFNTSIKDDETTIDEQINIHGKSNLDVLKELNVKMQNIAPERIKKLISTTLRKDTAIVKMLKEAADFKCQFPGCRHQIKTRKGAFYIEVAHIEAVKKGGQSILGNLIVLCPNHHKEFDLGLLKITEQSLNKLSGILNEKEFTIALNFTNT